MCHNSYIICVQLNAIILVRIRTLLLRSHERLLAPPVDLLVYAL